MPLQRFRPSSGRCKLCAGEVEIAISGAPPDQMECPQCGQEVQRCPSLVAPPPRILKRPGPAAARDAGFQTFKRVDDNVFEKQ